MLKKSIFNKKRFAQLLKINHMLSWSAYLGLLIVMLAISLIISFLFIRTSSIHPIDGSNTLLVDANYRGNFLIVMTIMLFIIGSTSFRNLESRMQPIQTLLPVSTFERYLICVFEFLAAFFIGIIIISLCSAVIEQYSNWRYLNREEYASILVTPFTFLSLFKNIGVFMQTLIGFAAFYFMVVAVRLFITNKSFWKVATILFVIFCVIVLLYLAVDFFFFGIPENIGDRLLIDITDDSETVYTFLNFTTPIILTASVWIGYNKLKNKKQ